MRLDLDPGVMAASLQTMILAHAYRYFTSAEVAKTRLLWAIREDRAKAIDPLTDHRVRLMANQIADAELERKEREAVWRAMGKT